MSIRSVRHRGLRRPLEQGNSRFLRRERDGRVRNILTAAVLTKHMDGFVAGAPPGWRVHRISGDRCNEWRVSVSGHWRMRFEEADGAIRRLNLEDYH